MRDDQQRPQPARKLGVFALEQRMLLDGAAVATAADAVADSRERPTHQRDAVRVAPDVERALRDAGANRRATEAVFIDTSVAGYEKLVAGVSPNANVFFINGNSGGLDQMVAALAGGQRYDSIQIFSHGVANQITLGNAPVSLGTIDSYSTQLAEIGKSLKSGGDILLFGCDIAANADGKALVDRMAALTGADVAASTDATGSAAVGGDWNLEYRQGSIESIAAVDQQVLNTFASRLTLGWADAQFPLQNSDNAVGDEHGWAVAAADTTGWVVAGGWGQGDVYAYKPIGGGEFKEYKITPPDLATIMSNSRGVSVDVDGNFMIIGYGRNVGYDVKVMGQTSYAYIYEYVAGSDSWVLRHTMTGEAGFGTSVAIQADGTNYRAVIGAPEHTEGGATSYGVVFLTYSTNNGTTWVPFGGPNYYISPPGGADKDGYYDAELNFGISVAIDGDTLVVGANGWGYNDTNGSSADVAYHYVGRAYTYHWTNGNNSNIQDTTVDQVFSPDGGAADAATVISAPNANYADAPQLQAANFGFDVDIWDDLTTQHVISGAPGEGNAPNKGGEAYILTGNGSGRTVNMVPTAAQAPQGANYGYSVAIDGASNLAAVGAYSYNPGSYPETGRVIVYNTGGALQNVAESQITGVRFGWSVALARDLLVVGSPWFDTVAANTGDQNGLVQFRLYNQAPTANADWYYLWESVGQPLNVRGNDTDPNTTYIDPLKINSVGAPAAGTLTIVNNDVVWDPNGEYEYLRGYRNATYTTSNAGVITVTSANHGYQVGEWILLDTSSGGQFDQLQVVQSIIDANTFTLVPDWENVRYATYTRNAASNTIRVDANYDHFLTVGQQVYFDYTSGGMTTDKSYTVTNIVDSDTFDVTETGSVSGSGTYVKGAGTTTEITFTSVGHTRQVGDVLGIDFTSGSFTNRDSQYTITATTANTFTVTENPTTVNWNKPNNSLWWNLTFTHQVPVGGTMYVDFLTATRSVPADGTYTVIAGDASNNFNLQDNTTFLEGNANGANTTGSPDDSNGTANIYISQAAAANFSWSTPAASGNVTWVATTPGNAQILDVSLVQTTYTVSDNAGESSSAGIGIFVYGQNDPVVANYAIGTQVANAGSATTLFTAGNPMSSQTLIQLEAFTDADWRETHTYAFPSGLTTVTVDADGFPGDVAKRITFTINATTGAVSFTPGVGLVGLTYTVPGIRVSDASSSVNLNSFTVRIDRPNTAPTATGGTLAVTAWEDNYKPGTYSQAGTTITVTSTAHGLIVGDSIPMDFVSGTALDSSFTVASVINANSFTVTDTVSRTTSGNLLHGSVSGRSMVTEFTDNNPGEVLTYSLVGAPTWVAVGANNGLLQYFGTNDDMSADPTVATFTVRATDQYGLTADKTVQVSLNPVNDAPVVTNSVVDATAVLGVTYANTDPGAILKLPTDLFTDIDKPTANTFTLSAFLVDGTKLDGTVGSHPWLRFDPASGRFYTSAAVAGEIGANLSIRVIATDNGTPSLNSSYVFDLQLNPPAVVGGLVGGSVSENAAGSAVAVSEDGLWMVVGEPQANNFRGQVTLYRWTGTAWAFAQTLADPSPADNERYGYSVDINSNGTRIAVGAPGSASEQGAVYMYQRAAVTDATFNATAISYLQAAADRQGGDAFGFAVALNRDGSQLIVGAPGDDAASADAGAIYLFNWNAAGATTEQAKRLPVLDDGDANRWMNRFGSSLDFDGKVVVVGSPFDSSNGKFFNGSATVLGVAATNFTGTGVLKGFGEESQDFYGWDVAIDAYRLVAGNPADSAMTVAVGAPGSDLKDIDAGAVYTYRWAGMTGNGTQADLDRLGLSTQAPVLTAYDGNDFHRFGFSVSLDAQNGSVTSKDNDVADNGIRLAVGSNIDGGATGTAYIFRDWSSVTGNSWIGQRFVQATDPVVANSPENQYGFAVALSNAATSAYNAALASYTVAANGARLAAGAPASDIVRAGTYGRAGTTVTVTSTAHGLSVGQQVYIDYVTAASGTIPTDKAYTITSVAANTFTVTDTVTGTINTGSTLNYAVANTNGGAVHSVSSVGAALEATPTPKSQEVDKWLNNPGLAAPVDRPSTSELFAASSFWTSDLASRRDELLFAMPGAPVEIDPLATAFVAGAADADPLLFLLQSAPTEAAPVTGQAEAAAGGEQPEQAADAEPPAATAGDKAQARAAAGAPTLSRELQALGNRHAQSATALLARLEAAAN